MGGPEESDEKENTCIYMYVYMYIRVHVYMYIHVYMYVCVYIYIHVCVCVCVRGMGSSVGIETDYGQDGPGSNPGGDEIFRPSRPTLRPTQPPVKWIPGLSRG